MPWSQVTLHGGSKFYGSQLVGPRDPLVPNVALDESNGSQLYCICYLRSSWILQVRAKFVAVSLHCPWRLGKEPKKKYKVPLNNAAWMWFCVSVSWPDFWYCFLEMCLWCCSACFLFVFSQQVSFTKHCLCPILTNKLMFSDIFHHYLSLPLPNHLSVEGGGVQSIYQSSKIDFSCFQISSMYDFSGIVKIHENFGFV